MTNLQKLEAMSSDQFDDFFAKLPPRVQLLVKSGACRWKEILPQYLVPLEDQPIVLEDIPF